jgi:hypothetical protein
MSLPGHNIVFDGLLIWMLMKCANAGNRLHQHCVASFEKYYFHKTSLVAPPITNSIMPSKMLRISLRKQVLTELEHLSKRRRFQATIRSLISNNALMEEEEDDNDMFSIHVIVDKVVENVKQSILSRRYLFPRKP